MQQPIVAHNVTPKNLVLDLFRVAPEASPAPIASLVELGRLFGFAPSSMRTAVSRLTSAGLLESDARGWYRPSATSDPFRGAIESWRLGEARVRPWTGDWLAFESGSWSRRTDQRRTERALRYLGFRPALARLWLRPDNLALVRHDAETLAAPRTARSSEDTQREHPSLDLVEQLEALGATQLDEPFLARFSAQRIERFRKEQWDVAALEATYRRCARDIGERLGRVAELPHDQALVETFVYGGEAIRVLALDPLLPAELVDTDLRRSLFDRMIEYDRAGRARWHERFGIGQGASAETLQ